MKSWIAYNTENLNDYFIKKDALRLFNLKLINEVVLQNIYKTFVKDKVQKNIFLTIGVFIFTCVSIVGIMGILSIFLWDSILSNSTESTIAVLLFVLSVIFVIALEFRIKEFQYFRSGMEEAFLYPIPFLLGSIMVIWELPEFLIGFVLLIFTTFAAIRYLDGIMSIASYGLFIYLGVIVLANDLLFLPFWILFISVIVGWGAHRLLKNVASFIYFEHQLILLKIISFLGVYISCNYWLIDQIGTSVYGHDFILNLPVVLKGYFWCHTVSVPLVIFFYALKLRDRVLVRVSMLILLTMFLTLKYYLSLGHHAVTLLLSGTVLLALVFFVFKYFKNTKNGYGYSEGEIDESWLLGDKLPAFILTMDNTKDSEISDVKDFGGGSFGGGGAQSDF